MDAVVGLGSNLGSREAFLRVGTRLLGAHPRVRVTHLSPPYLTPPHGPPQPDYLNAAARVTTELAPLELLEHLHRVERELGRVREERWGPRTLDLDLLWWFGGSVREPTLSVPHPGLQERAFALAPLLDVAPELRPELGPTLARLAPRGPLVWTPIVRRGARLEVEGRDSADALALALDTALGQGSTSDEVHAVEVEDPSALLAELARGGARGGWLVVEDARPGAIRARFARDPALSASRLRGVSVRRSRDHVRVTVETSDDLL